MIEAYLRRLVSSLQSRLLMPASNGIAMQSRQIKSLRDDVAELRAAQETSNAARLQERVEQLETLLIGLSETSSQAHAESYWPSPAVTVVMPSWNRAWVISEAIRSVQSQSFTDWELIIVDDGSTDHTAEVVAAFAVDPRIRYIAQAHAGHSSARNRALGVAQGSLIGYLDSDNLWFPGFLHAAVTAFRSDPTIDSAYGALVSEPPGEGQRIQFSPFHRRQLLQGRSIDLNTFVHRRVLVDTCGAFDESLTRLVDWDLILRYTLHSPARRLPVLAARYRMLDETRISNIVPLGPNHLRILMKWRETSSLSRQLRVLYVVWHYPQLSESYVDTEIRCMQSWGVHIEVWAEHADVKSDRSSTPVHAGSLEQAIAACRPDVLHIHWLHFAISHREQLLASGIPLTIRAHGFDVTDETIHAVLALPTLRRAFCFPHQIAHLAGERRVTPMPPAFDSSLFHPAPDKDRHLVLRTGPALPSKDLQLFFDVAKRLPEHRFVMALATCLLKEAYVDELVETVRATGSPVELMIDVPRDKLALIVQQAGLHLHTTNPPHQRDAIPIGMPISIAEAMATGSHVLVRGLPQLAAYVGDAGNTYRDAEHAAKLISETATWTESRWKQAWLSSVDRAFLHHADQRVLQPLFDEWCSIAGASPHQ